MRTLIIFLSMGCSEYGLGLYNDASGSIETEVIDEGNIVVIEDTGEADTEAPEYIEDTEAPEDTEALEETGMETDECSEAVACYGDYYPTSSRDMDDLRKCSSVSGILSLGSEIDWLEDPNLPCLESVGGSWLAINSPSFIKIDSLSNLSYTGLHMQISGDKLKDISGLSNLSTIGGELQITNTKLENLDGLEGLTTISGLSIHHNDNLVHLSGIENLTDVEGVLNISSNPLIDHLTDLKIERVESLHVGNNASLCNANAQDFAGQIEIKVSTYIGNNRDCDGSATTSPCD